MCSVDLSSRLVCDVDLFVLVVKNCLSSRLVVKTCLFYLWAPGGKDNVAGPRSPVNVLDRRHEACAYEA